MDFYGEKCLKCGITLEDCLKTQGRPLTLDHVRPRRAPYNGSNRLFNLQILCQPCNGANDEMVDYRPDKGKHFKTPEDEVPLPIIPPPPPKPPKKKKPKYEKIHPDPMMQYLVNRYGHLCMRCFRATAELYMNRVNPNKDSTAQDYQLLCHGCKEAREQEGGIKNYRPDSGWSVTKAIDERWANNQSPSLRAGDI